MRQPRRMRSWLRRFPRLRSLAYLLRHPDVVYSSVSNDLSFHPRDHYHHEIAQRKEFIRKCFAYLTFNQIEGDYAEFGCYGAVTFRLAYSASRLVEYPARLWGFDSFSGLPPPSDERDRHPKWIEGDFATAVEEFRTQCRDHGIDPKDYDVVAGYYEQTLKPDAEGPRPERISFAYIDCDLYSSTRDVLRFLSTKLQPGLILAFDDYYCNSTTGPSGERLAAAEFVRENIDWRLVPYHPFGWHGMSFILESRSSVADGTAGW